MPSREKRALLSGGGPGKSRKQRKFQSAHVGRGTVSLTPTPSQKRTLATKKIPSARKFLPSDDEDTASMEEEIEKSPAPQGARLDRRVGSVLPNNERTERDVAGFGVLGPYGTADPVDGSVEAVKKIISATELRLVKHMNMLYNRAVSRISNCESHLEDLSTATTKVQSGVSEVKMLALRSSASAVRSKPTRKVGGKTKTTLKEEVEAKHSSIGHEMEVAFSPEVVCKSCAHRTSTFMESCHRKQDDVRMTARALSVLMYGLPNSLTKSEFKYGLGKKHAKFRFSVAKNCISNSRMLSEDAFRHHERLVLADLVRKKGTSIEAARDMVDSVGKPPWLAPGFISREIMDMSRMFHECVKSEIPKLPTNPDKKLALHVGRTVVSIVNDMLRRSRHSTKKKMFESGLFLLMKWRNFKAFNPEIHSQPTLQFMFQHEPPIATIEIPECHAELVDGYADKNSRILCNLVKERKEMIVQAEYSVSVNVRSSIDRGDADLEVETKTMKRSINVLRMAYYFLQAYCHVSGDKILSYHPLMLRQIYRIALLFRELFIESIPVEDRPPRSFIGNLEIFGDGSTSRSPNVACGGRATREHNEEDDGSRKENENDTEDEVGPDRNGGIQNASNTVETGANRPGDIRCIRVEHLVPSQTEMENYMLRVLVLNEDTFNRIRIEDRVGDDDPGEEAGQDEAHIRVDPSDEEVESEDDLSDMVDTE